MKIVTGGAGFIGSNIVKALNQRGHKDIIVVDDLTDGHKFVNLVNCEIQDYIDKMAFLKMIESGHSFPEKIDIIFHQGACSATTEWDGKYMMENNYEYSKSILAYTQVHAIPFVYASSAAVYGGSDKFVENLEYEQPLNVYGYSKYLFDQYLRAKWSNLKSQVVGLRYFNVYGPAEQHKGSMASVAFHLNNQIKDSGKIKLFEGCDGYGNGEQRRDFIYVEDVVNVNLWFMDNQEHKGIFNVGTGRSQPFNDVAQAVLDWHGTGTLEYISFPEHLKGCYQSYTEADISYLRNIGYDQEFKSVSEGVKAYLNIINTNA